MAMTIPPEMIWKIAGLVIALGLLVFFIYYAVIRPLQTQCWRDIQAEFNNQLNFPMSKLGSKEFYIPAIMDATAGEECIKAVAFTDGESGCRSACDMLEDDGDRQKCKALCAERCKENEQAGKTGDCIVLVPAKRSWLDALKVWNWPNEAPWDTMRKIYHNVIFYSAGGYELQTDFPENMLLPEKDKNIIHCLKFELDSEGKTYTISDAGQRKNDPQWAGDFKEKCRDGKIGNTGTS
jgi:hypothetical protein